MGAGTGKSPLRVVHPPSPYRATADAGGKTLTMGDGGSLEAPPGGDGPAVTFLHGSVPVEREGSKPGE